MARPRKELTQAAIANAAADLFASGGYEAVTIIAVAKKLHVSRATLYRTIATKDELMVVLFERSTQRLLEATRELIAERRRPAEELEAMVALLANTAVETRRHLAVFFGGQGLGPDAYKRWREFTRAYDDLWLGVVKRSMKAGIIPKGNPVLTTRLVLGMLIWISRWYRPAEEFTVEEIAAHALQILQHPSPNGVAVRNSSSGRAASSRARTATR
jgi:AcrR family transcriptional regulator